MQAQSQILTEPSELGAAFLLYDGALYRAADLLLCAGYAFCIANKIQRGLEVVFQMRQIKHQVLF